MKYISDYLGILLRQFGALLLSLLRRNQQDLRPLRDPDTAEKENKGNHQQKYAGRR